MGSLEQRGNVMEVQDDFELLCWDFVSTPSNPGSYMHTLTEGKQTYTYDYSIFGLKPPLLGAFHFLVF